MSITVQTKVRIPKAPDHFMLEGSGKRGMKVLIKDFTREDLEAIGAEWTKQLLEAAGYGEPKRKTPTKT